MKCETIRILMIALTLLYRLFACKRHWSWSVVPILRQPHRDQRCYQGGVASSLDICLCRNGRHFLALMRVSPPPIEWEYHVTIQGPPGGVSRLKITSMIRGSFRGWAFYGNDVEAFKGNANADLRYLLTVTKAGTHDEYLHHEYAAPTFNVHGGGTVVTPEYFSPSEFWGGLSRYDDSFKISPNSKWPPVLRWSSRVISVSSKRVSTIPRRARVGSVVDFEITTLWDSDTSSFLGASHRYLFGHLPDASEMQKWGDRLAQGWQPSWVRDSVVDSVEAKGRLSDGAFVDLLYLNYLQRRARRRRAASPLALFGWRRKQGAIEGLVSESRKRLACSPTTIL